MKKTIFLSHISEEGRLGTLFKDRLEKDFLSLIDVFVSSDARSIPPGDAWLKAVDNNLNEAAALIVLASPQSVTRPWITFEAGAGWAKHVPTMLVCHSGMAPGSLPLPLGQLQAFAASDIVRLKAMYQVIAGVLGSATPEPDLSPFIEAIRTFEHEHTEERDILGALRIIKAAEPKVVQFLRTQQPHYPCHLQQMAEHVVRKMEPGFDQLKQRGLLTWSYSMKGLFFGPNGGNSGDVTLTMMPAVVSALQRPEFA